MFNRDVIKYSVEEAENGNRASLTQPSGVFWFGRFAPTEDDVLAPWGTPQGHRELRQAWYSLYATLPISAQTNLIRRWVGTAWEVKSQSKYKPRLVRNWQERLQQANWGAGWGRFLWPLAQDYLNQDLGAFVEIIGKGSPDKPLRGEVMGIRALDALRCYPTGDPEFPIWYASHKTGKLHQLHHTRVHRLIDSPSPDPDMREMGLCATRRVFAVLRVQELMMRYQIEKLDDLPPAGVGTISGLTNDQWQQAKTIYEDQRQNDNQSIFRNIIEVVGIRPDTPVQFNLTPFSQLPDQFDYQTYMEMHVNLIALALSDDPQEIWPLSGQRIGTATQSNVLHAKGRAKMYGTFLQEVERLFNIFILPPELELTFKPRDTEQDQARAESARMWTGVALDAKNSIGITDQQAQQLLANTVPEWADVLLDETGNLRLDDQDVLPDTANTEVPPVDENNPPADVISPDNQPLPAPPNNATPDTTIAQDDNTLTDTQKVTKDIQATRSDFENDWLDIVTAANNKSVSRARAGSRMRSLIARDGNKAYRDGLQAGGVDPADISEDDLNQIDSLIRLNQGQVGNLLDVIYRNGLTDNEVQAKPALWWNGSMNQFYNAGRMSADRNGVYEFAGKAGADSCPDCQRLEGQVHRFKDWYNRNLDVPKVGQSTQCGGYNCNHILVKTTGRAQGRF